jgi:uncharacterized membrane protein
MISLSKYFKLIWVGIILLVFGVTLVVTSYPRIYNTYESIIPIAHVLPIEANSSSDFLLNFNPFLGTLFPKPQKVLVVVTGSQELEGILNSTSNYDSTMKAGQNITISLVSQYQTISATERSAYAIVMYDEPVVPHMFDIPADWSSWFYVRVTNPESYPVCWVVNVLGYAQVVDNNWLTVFFVGTILIILGAILVGVSAYRRKGIAMEKPEPTTSEALRTD